MKAAQYIVYLLSITTLASRALDIEFVGFVEPNISKYVYNLEDSIFVISSGAEQAIWLDTLSTLGRRVNIDPDPDIIKKVNSVVSISNNIYEIFANRQRNQFCWPYIYRFNLNDTGFVEEHFHELNLPWTYCLVDAEPIISSDYMILYRNERYGRPGDFFAARLTPEGDTLWSRMVMTREANPQRQDKNMIGLTPTTTDASLFCFYGISLNLDLNWSYWLCATQIDTTGEVRWHREYAWGRPGYLMGVDITGLHAFDDGTYGVIGTWDVNVGYLHFAANGDSLGSFQYARGTSSRGYRTVSLLLHNQNILVIATCEFLEIDAGLGLYYINEQGDSLDGYFFNMDTVDNAHFGPMLERPDGKVMLWVGGDPHWPGVVDVLYTLYPDGRPGEVAPYETPDQPACFLLHPAYPNPFNSTTVISFNLPAASPVSIKAFDLTGREVQTLTQGFLSAGEHRLVWNAGGIGAGSYLLRLETPIQTNIQKVNIVK